MNTSTLPTIFKQTIQDTFRERGDNWLADLPSLLQDYAEYRQLTLLPPYPNLSFNYVAPVLRADGTEAVLKAGVPCYELRQEMDALKCFDSDGMVRLLDADGDRGVLLLERLRPGDPLTTLATEENDEQATAITVAVMKKLHRPAPANQEFPTISDWGDGFNRLRSRFGGTGPFPARLLEEAETLYLDLTSSMSAPVLLHGDLHHDNILSSGPDSWTAIDPKGVIGEPAYESGAMLRNLWLDRHTISNPTHLMERRVLQLAEGLSENPARIRGWGIAQAVLSAWWCLEDNSDCWKEAIEIAEMLSRIRL